MDGFSLSSHQVPSPPGSSDWCDHLRWAVMISDPGTSDFKWSAFLLTSFLKVGHLSSKQADVGNEILMRLRDRFCNGDLWCQAGEKINPDQGGLRLVHSDDGESA